MKITKLDWISERTRVLRRNASFALSPKWFPLWSELRSTFYSTVSQPLGAYPKSATISLGFSTFARDRYFDRAREAPIQYPSFPCTCPDVMCTDLRVSRKSVARREVGNRWVLDLAWSDGKSPSKGIYLARTVQNPNSPGLEVVRS